MLAAVLMALSEAEAATLRPFDLLDSLVLDAFVLLAEESEQEILQ